MPFEKSFMFIEYEQILGLKDCVFFPHLFYLLFGVVDNSVQLIKKHCALRSNIAQSTLFATQLISRTAFCNDNISAPVGYLP